MSKGLLSGLALAGLMALCACKSTPKGERMNARAKQEMASAMAKANVNVVTNLTAIESTNRIRSEWLQAPTNFYTLGPGDKLEIEIMNEPTSRSMTTIGPDGKVYYYLLPGIDVWGLTLVEARDRIQEALTKVVVAPQVGIQLRG